MRKLITVLGLLLLVVTAGCSFAEKEANKNANQEVEREFTDEDILESFGIGTEHFDAMTYSDITLTKDDGEGVLEYTLDYKEHDLNVEMNDFKFGPDLYYVLSMDLELLTHIALDDIGDRNEKLEDTTDNDQYTGVIYNIKDIGVVELDIDHMVHYVYDRKDTIEFSWFIDNMKWDSKRIQEMYEGFTNHN